MLPEQYRGVAGGEKEMGVNGAGRDPDVVEIAEVWAYLGVLCQVRLDLQRHYRGSRLQKRMLITW